MLNDRWARIIMLAALAVTMPSLMMTFLLMEGVGLPETIQAVIVGTSAACLALAATGGQMFVIHHVAQERRGRGVLIPIWCFLVLGSTSLIACGHVARISHEGLEVVLDAGWLAEHEVLVAIAFAYPLLAELVAAAAAVALAGAGAGEEQRAEQSEQLEAIARERNALEVENQRLVERMSSVEQSLLLTRAPEQTPATTGAGLGAATEHEEQMIRLPCRNACGWTSPPLPHRSARKSEAGHYGRCRRRRPRDRFEPIGEDE